MAGAYANDLQRFVQRQDELAAALITPTRRRRGIGR